MKQYKVIKEFGCAKKEIFSMKHMKDTLKWIAHLSALMCIAIVICVSAPILLTHYWMQSLLKNLTQKRKKKNLQR